MYDSTNMAEFPATAPIVAGYPHAWTIDYEKYPDALWVRIDNNGKNADDCGVLDVEKGAATPQIAAEWIQSWHKLHPSGMAAHNGHFARPTIYCSENALTSLRGVLAGLTYDVIVANWSTGITPVAGTVGKQYQNSDQTGHDYDLSVIYDVTWGVHPADAPPPTVVTAHAVLVTSTSDLASGALSVRRVASLDGGHTWQ